MVLFQTYFQVPKGYDAGITFLEGLDTHLHQKFPEIRMVQSFISDLHDLFHKSSFQVYTRRYQELSPNWSKRIHDYYSKNIHPEVDKSIERWHLEEQGVYSPFSGVSNNQSESFNAVMKQLEAWKKVPVDSLVLSFYYLQCFFMNEISRGICNQGNYHLNSAFLHLLETPKNVDFIDDCVLPKDIVKYIK